MADNELKLKIDLAKTGTGGTEAKAELKEVTDEAARSEAVLKEGADESARYQAALQAMADKEEAAKDGTRELNQAVREYAEQVKAAKDEMESSGGAFIPDELAGKLKDTGKAMDDEGEAASHAAGKHLALRRIMGELNRISPGLGEALHLVAEAYMTAGESAEDGAVGVEAFTAALDELLVSLGPLIIGMLAIEATFQYWDMYKEKVNAAATAQEEATKRIVESTKLALKAVQELDEAMHPEKKNIASQDEENLKHQDEALTNAYTRQKELNKAQEEKELAGAGSNEEKEAIKQRFEMLDTQLEDWRAKQKAAIEGSMVGTMQAQLQQLKNEGDELVKKSGPLFQMMKERRTDTDRNNYNAVAQKIQENADEAKAIREKLDDLTGEAGSDAGNAAFNSETNRQKYAIGGTKYVAPNAGYQMPSPNVGVDDAANNFATGKAIADQAARGEQISQAQAQFLIVLEQAVTGHAQTWQSAAALIEKQSSNQQYAATLIQNAHSRIDAVEEKLREIGEWQRNLHHFTT